MRLLTGTAASWQSEFGNSFQGRRTLVTGATGFIGWHLCQALVDLGSEVVGLARSASIDSLPRGVSPLTIDLCQRRKVAAALRNTRYDVIFHLAGLVTASRERELVIPMIEANFLGTVNLLLAAKATNCGRFVWASSSEEPAQGSDGAPTSPYAASKFAAGAYGLMFCRIFGLPFIGVRLFLTYGPRQQASKLVPYTITSLLRGERPSLSNPNKVCDALYVADAVRGFLKAAHAPRRAEGRLFDLGTGKGITIRQLAETAAKLIDSPLKPKFGAHPARQEEENRVADLAQTKRYLGWQPRWTLEEGLGETIQWYKEHGNSRK